MQSSPSTDDEAAPQDHRRDVLKCYRQHVNASLAGYCDLLGAGIETRSDGCYVYDHAGKQLLDCGGFNVFLLGHRHPRVTDAVRKQLDCHPLATRLLINEQFALAAQSVAGVAPEGLDYVWFANSGAEAVEAGIKLAWLNGCRRMIAMQGAYHGKTLGALSVTGREEYRSPFQELLPPVTRIPFGDSDALAAELAGDERCCVILEPVQSENGVVIPPTGYLEDVEQQCRRHQAVLILDEISTGLGRLGTWWGCESEAIVPDVLLAGKALGGGVMPVSAAICSEAIFKPLNENPLLHTSTFAGNPLAAVAAMATVETIAEENLIQRGSALGEHLLAQIRSILMQQCPQLIHQVRGRGLLIGIEFEEESRATRFIYELLQRGVISSHSLNAGHVVRLTPPAVMKEEEVAWLLGAVQQTAERMGRRFRRRSA